jgi:hypothetical protein
MVSGMFSGMRLPILCLLVVGCGVSGYRVARKPDAPALSPPASAELVDAPPAGGQELGRVEVIGFEGEACKTEARERARTLLGATHVVVAPHPDPFSWQNTQPATLAAPRCVGTGYAAAPGTMVGAPPSPPPATPPAEPPAASPAPPAAAPAPG